MDVIERLARAVLAVSRMPVPQDRKEPVMADLNIVMVHLQTFFSSKGVGRDPKSVQEYLADIGGAPFSRGLPKTQRWT